MKTKIKVQFVSIFALTLAISGCYYDNEEDLYINPNVKDTITICDTTNITYSKTLAPIFENNCNGCHSSSIATSGIVTDNYNAVKLNINQIKQAINLPVDNPLHMPPGYDLSDCDKNKIYIWDTDGQKP